jgi:hypothetical protein
MRAFLIGLLAASSLIVGAAIALIHPVRRSLLGLIMGVRFRGVDRRRGVRPRRGGVRDVQGGRDPARAVGRLARLLLP